MVACRVSLKPSEEALVLDLVERGIELFPSGLSQLASRSKVLQTRLFSQYMVPLTHSVHDIHDLTEAMAALQREKIGQVVTKLDRKDAGLGIHLWNSVEEIYNQASLGVLPFPFVLQPFVSNSRDVRAIFLGDYEEAYERANPTSFRNNLHFGGQSSPWQLTKEQGEMCLAVMERGKFPYAHVDLMVLEDGTFYLAEINLRGGIRGAKIKGGEYNECLTALYDAVIQTAKS